MTDLFVARGAQIRRWPAAAAGVIALIAIAVSVRPAGAAPALSVSENPVVISEPATTKGVTFSYNTGGLPNVFLIITQVENPSNQTQVPLSQMSGTHAFTVTYPYTYYAELRSNSITIVDLVVTTKRPGTITINPNATQIACALYPCLTLNLTVHGTYVQAAWSTTKAAGVVFEVSTSPPSANGTLQNPVGWFNTCCATSGMVPLYNLKAGTKYYYAARATAADGSKRTKTGEFTTLNRRVEVTFISVTMLDDSDALSDCDCIFWFKAGGASPKQYLDTTTGVPSGATLLPNVKFTIDNAPDSLALKVEGYDQDRSCLNAGLLVEVCGCGAHAPNFDTGSVDGKCGGQWATASKTVHTTATGTVGPGYVEAYTEAFQMTTPSGLPKFLVSGVFKVSYVP